MATSIESILERLLQPNNEIIAQATNELKTVYKQPAIIEQLFSCLCNSPNAGIRQYAAILLRRKIRKNTAWRSLKPEIRQGLRDNILQRLVAEKEFVVFSSICELVACITKHQVNMGVRSWSELQTFLDKCTQSNDVAQIRLGYCLLSVVATETPDFFASCADSLFKAFKNDVTKDERVAFYIIKSLAALKSLISSSNQALLSSMIPTTMNIVRAFAEQGDDKCFEALNFYDALLSIEIPVLSSHIQELVMLCLDLACNTKLDAKFRKRATTLLQTVIALKKGVIVKQKLIHEIIERLFVVMGEIREEGDIEEGEGDPEVEDEAEYESVAFCAAQVLDVMALHMPPDRLLSILTPLVERSLRSEDPFVRKAAFLTTAVVAEGCSETIKKKYLQQFVTMVCGGIVDSSIYVRNASLFALGQFGSFLQPEVAKYNGQILPVLITYILKTAQEMQQTGKCTPHVSKMFYALENLLGDSDDDGHIKANFGPLMEGLMIYVDKRAPFHARELGLSALGAVANAVTAEDLEPYFQTCLEVIRYYVTLEDGFNSGQDERITAEKCIALRTSAVDTLSVILRHVRAELVEQIAGDCMQLGLSLVDNVDDPDLRRCTFGLFGALSQTLGEKMIPFMEPVLKHMFAALASNEGVVIHDASKKDEKGDMLALFAELEDGEGDCGEGEKESEDDDADIREEEDQDNSDDDAALNVENAYLEEKRDTCDALGEIADNMKEAYFSYLEVSFEKVWPLIEHPSGEVYQAAIEALGKFTVLFYKRSIASNATDSHRADVHKATAMLVSELINRCREELDRHVVTKSFDVLGSVISGLGETLFAVERGSAWRDEIAALVRDALKHQLPAQNVDDEDYDVDSEDEAEYDALLVEVAADLIPLMAKAIKPASRFAPIFAGLFNLLLKRMKPGACVGDSSHTVGILAETVEFMDDSQSLQSFVAPLYKLFMEAAAIPDHEDQDYSEVRSNALYGLGVLAKYAGNALDSEYPRMLELLSMLFTTEKGGRCRDNLCGCLARMILARRELVPLDAVLASLAACLPLLEDIDENTTCFQCIVALYRDRVEQFAQNFPLILGAILDALASTYISDETRSMLVELLKTINSADSQLCTALQTCVGAFSMERQATFTKYIMTTK